MIGIIVISITWREGGTLIFKNCHQTFFLVKSNSFKREDNLYIKVPIRNDVKIIKNSDRVIIIGLWVVFSYNHWKTTSRNGFWQPCKYARLHVLLQPLLSLHFECSCGLLIQKCFRGTYTKEVFYKHSIYILSWRLFVQECVVSSIVLILKW